MTGYRCVKKFRVGIIGCGETAFGKHIPKP